MKTTLDVHSLIGPDALAVAIGNKWQGWSSFRSRWIEEKKELRNFVFATDTRTTENRSLPWANTTTTPKITQIYDNLKANYIAALFPNAHWMKWQARDNASATKQKTDTVQGYMETKLDQSDFELTAHQLVDDWVLFGNCFATVVWDEDIKVSPEGLTHAGYIGPRLQRISPYDIVFDPTAISFSKTPKIIRSILSMGQVAKMAEDDPEMKVIYEKMQRNRLEVTTPNVSVEKSDGFVADGFGDISLYYSSGHVELLTFYGDLYDVESGEAYSDYKITIIDRSYVVSKEPIAEWLGGVPVYHAGWRARPDNLYAMGPLDNLVGLQYRIDHLENLKADVFDQIAYPIVKIKGDVEDFDYQPGTRIYEGEEGDVSYLTPDTTALNADFQIGDLMRKMEELAGAPSSAMGIRTPGEKTAFEVNTLNNAANRIFQHKANQFERMFLTPVLNAMFISALTNLDKTDVIRIVDDAQGVTVMEDITRDDLKGNGKIEPVGASHFAERATRLQNLQSVQQFKQDPTVGPHLSGKKIAEVLAQELNEREMFGENITVVEQLETQRATQQAEAINVEELAVQEETGI